MKDGLSIDALLDALAQRVAAKVRAELARGRQRHPGGGFWRGCCLLSAGRHNDAEPRP